MSRIVLLGTGGTIASRAQGSGGTAAEDDSAALLGTVDVPDPHRITSVDVVNVNSFNLQLADLRAIGGAVRAALADPTVDGIVITHGTDTLEETAAFLDAIHDDERPVVLTGAQRAADLPGADGPVNLADAICVARAPESRGRGVLVSFAGEIHAGFGVRKAHTIAPQPFVNRLGGPVGRMAPSGPVYRRLPEVRPRLVAPDERFDDVRVDIVSTYPGGDGALIDAAVAAGARGIVVLGTGTGNPGLAATESIARAVASGVVVALGTRVESGPVQPIYGGGGAVDAVAAGAVPLGALTATQARVLLALLLSHGGSDDARRRLGDLARRT